MEVTVQDIIKRYESGELGLLDMCRELSGGGADPMENVRAAMESGTLGTLFDSQAATAVHEAFSASSAPLDKLCASMEAPSFGAFYDLAINAGGMEYLPSGGRCNESIVTATGEPMKVARFAGSLVVDEIHIINGGVEAMLTIPTRQLARQANSVLLNQLAFALLANPTMSDGTAMFDSSRGNDANATLDESGLAAARAYFKTLKDANGNCLDLDAAVLVCSAALDSTARELLSKTQNFGAAAGNLELVTSGRLDAGVKDPISGTEATPSATFWAVLPNPAQYPAFNLLYRKGTNKGLLSRVSKLGPGRRGYSVDVTLDSAIVPANAAAIYRGHA